MSRHVITAGAHDWQTDHNKLVSNHFQSVQLNLTKFDHWPLVVNHLLYETLLDYCNSSPRCRSTV